MLHKLGIIQWTEISRSRSQADVEINAILCTSHPLSAGGVELSLHSDFQKLGGWGGEFWKKENHLEKGNLEGLQI